VVAPIETIVAGTIETPLGPLQAICSAQGLCRLTFAGEEPAACARWRRCWLPDATMIDDDGRLDTVATQLAAYFDGTLHHFTVPLDLRGTPFQRRVWEALCAIPYGAVRSYAQHALAIDQPRAVRAVGAANGANPIAIVVPCHRLIGSRGSLVKYGGGLQVKRYLLDHEGADLAAVAGRG
jgi:O-6-methylguanine DNA methyltransferase